MKRVKVINKAFFSFLAISVFTLSVFCCCLSDVSYAQPETPAASVPECHSHAASQEAPSQEECDCPQVISIAIQKSDTNIQFTQLNTFKLGDIFSSSSSAQQILDDSAGLLAYQSPPQKYKEAVPLYLKHSILRL